MVTTPAKYGGLGMLGVRAGTPSRPMTPTRVGAQSPTRIGAQSPTKRANGSSNGVKGENICVSVRFRPPNKKESAAPNGTIDSPVWLVDEQSDRIRMQSEQLGKLHRLSEDNDYGFDHVFGGNECRQSQLYQSTVSPVIRLAMEGYNGLVFAYGATGSGKTWTMSGSSTNPGVISRAIEEIFEIIQGDHRRRYLLRASYLEIYNEELRDLLSPNSQPRLIDDTRGRPQVKPLNERVVTTPNEVYDTLDKGTENRHVGTTDWNDRSSRSHTVFSIVIESELMPGVQLTGDADDKVKISKISLIDLAGSERATSQESRRAEGAHINRSLLSLGNVISKLVDKSPHIPYRDSKLTRLLQPSLSGDARIAVICTASPAASSITETSNTLKFAARCKQVTTSAKQGIVASDQSALISQYEAELSALRKRLDGNPEANEKVTAEVTALQMEKTMLQKQIENLENQMLSWKSVNRNVSSAATDSSRRMMRQLSQSRPPAAIESSSEDLDKIRALQEELERAKETIEKSDLAARAQLSKITNLERDVEQERQDRAAARLALEAALEARRQFETDLKAQKNETEGLRDLNARLNEDKIRIGQAMEKLMPDSVLSSDADLLTRIAKVADLAGEATAAKDGFHVLQAELSSKTKTWEARLSSQEEALALAKQSLRESESTTEALRAELQEHKRLLQDARETTATRTNDMSQLEDGLATKEEQISALMAFISKCKETIASQHDKIAALQMNRAESPKRPTNGLVSNAVSALTMKNQSINATKAVPLSPRRAMQ